MGRNQRDKMKHTKKFPAILLILLFTLSVFNGCDSPSGAKPDPVTRPSLSSPIDNATNVSLTPTFTWTGAADIIEVGTNPNFSPAVYSASVSGESHTIPANKKLSKNTRYYWHAGKKSGSDIFWSDNKFTFETIH